MTPDDGEDISTNPSATESFAEVAGRAISRRRLLRMGAGLGVAAFLGGSGAALAGEPRTGTAGRSSGPVRVRGGMGFAPVRANSGDAVVVPRGYRVEVLAPWGAALFADSPCWRDDGTNTGADQARQVGDYHDGMHLFPLPGKDADAEGLLVVNHESTDYAYLFGAGSMEPWTADKVLKAQHAHGVSVLHVRRRRGRWKVDRTSPFNRRLTARSPMEVTGPAAGHDLLKTAADPTGRRVLGTLNNCGSGRTPWGTYLTCEENFNLYFDGPPGGDPPDAAMRRYGVGPRRRGLRWEDFDERFHYRKEPNEANRFGWVVEIDPFDPASTPKKRTALGRFKHENCALTLASDGRVVVYSGDDQAGEYLYKFVSDGRYRPGDERANRDLLDSGRLYVARFVDGAATGDFMGTGEWLLLDREENPVLAASDAFASQAEVLIRARLAADRLGATPMDRPEWVAVHPASGEVYCSLTGNPGRTVTDGANPRAANRYGQIVRWREAGGDAAATRFEWDLFVLAGNPIAWPDRSDLRSGSDNVTSANTFSGPDGVAFDANGRLWIQTDGDPGNSGDFRGQGNNQMLCADPDSGEIRRFLVGPAGCEITGLTWTPDHRTMFVNVQHPGEAHRHARRPKPPEGGSIGAFLAANPTAFTEWPKSQWPGIEGGGRPRSAVVVITKEDGGIIGA